MTERNEIFHAIQQVIAGHSEREGLIALVSSLVVAIGVSAESLEHAKRTIDGLPKDMKATLIAEWPKLRAHRQRADIRASIEAGTGGIH